MTSNFKEFEKYVENKFIKMSYFAKLIYDNFHTLTFVSRLNDNAFNRIKIDNLFTIAKETDFIREKVLISEEEREIIKSWLSIIINQKNKERNQKYQNDSSVRTWSKYRKTDWFRDNEINYRWYLGMINGMIPEKNDNYDEFYKIIQEAFNDIKIEL